MLGWIFWSKFAALWSPPVGRMVFELYDKVVPRTVMNFLELMTGIRGNSPISGHALSYRVCFIYSNSVFVIKIQLNFVSVLGLPFSSNHQRLYGPRRRLYPSEWNWRRINLWRTFQWFVVHFSCFLCCICVYNDAFSFSFRWELRSAPFRAWCAEYG